MKKILSLLLISSSLSLSAQIDREFYDDIYDDSEYTKRISTSTYNNDFEAGYEDGYEDGLYEARINRFYRGFNFRYYANFWNYDPFWDYDFYAVNSFRPSFGFGFGNNGWYIGFGWGIRPSFGFSWNSCYGGWGNSFYHHHGHHFNHPYYYGNNHHTNSAYGYGHVGHSYYDSNKPTVGGGTTSGRPVVGTIGSNKYYQDAKVRNLQVSNTVKSNPSLYATNVRNNTILADQNRNVRSYNQTVRENNSMVQSGSREAVRNGRTSVSDQNPNYRSSLNKATTRAQSQERYTRPSSPASVRTNRQPS
ncbi:MAG: hypothetical protein ACPG6V_14015, partial [Flavobacteriales bacterium]